MQSGRNLWRFEAIDTWYLATQGSAKQRKAASRTFKRLSTQQATAEPCDRQRTLLPPSLPQAGRLTGGQTQHRNSQSASNLRPLRENHRRLRVD